MPILPCIWPDCDRKRETRDWCHRHYEYLRSRGELPAKPCRGCGSPLPARRHYCSDDCKPRCSVESCSELARTRGWCIFHFTRWKLTGDPVTPIKKTVYERGLACAFEGCDRPRRKYELCAAHDTQRRSGKELRPIIPKSNSYICAFCGGPSGIVSGYRKCCSSACTRLFIKHGGPLPDEWVCSLCGEAFPYVVEGRRRVKHGTRMCGSCRANAAKHGYSAAQLAKRDGVECKLCGDPVDMSLVHPDLMRGSVDHIVPKSLGGSNEPDNVQLAHLHCNIKKNNRVDLPA